MKKIKMVLVALAIVAATGGAFASKTLRAPCEADQQYMHTPNGYWFVDPYYYCLQANSVYCTYWMTTDWNGHLVYRVCQYGYYTVEH